MSEVEEVRCPSCGTLNRLRSYSFSQIPWCGSCRNALPEKLTKKAFRFLYSARTILAVAAVAAAVIVWQLSFETLNLSDVGASKRQVTKSTVSCQNQPQPIHGIFARYGNFDPIAPFIIRTRSGSNYFVKLENAETGRAIATYYVYGGVPLDTQVPAGTYVLKYAVGQAWCSETDLFGDATATEKADRLFRFDDGYEYEVELIAQRGGNLRTSRISRDQF